MSAAEEPLTDAALDEIERLSARFSPMPAREFWIAVLDRGGSEETVEARAFAALCKRHVPSLAAEVRALRAEVERLGGIVDDISSESGHALLIDDEEHEAPHLADWVRDGFRENAALRAKLDALVAAAGTLRNAMTVIEASTHEFVHWDEAVEDMVEGQEWEVVQDHNKMLGRLLQIRSQCGAALAAARQEPARGAEGTDG